MLMRFDPFRDLDRLTQQFWASTGRPTSLGTPMDAYRDGERFIVHLDLPGIDPSSIDLTVEKNVLTVRAERSWQRSEGQEVIAAERPQGTFTRQLFLGESLDSERIAASYDNGVLTVTLPVAEQAKPRKVEVSAGNGTTPAIETTSASA